MASSKAAGSWAELQESFNRVRQQYDLFPPAGWTTLAALDAQENAVFVTQRKKTTSIPLFPNLSQDASNAQIRKGNKQHTEGFLRNQHDRDLRLKLPPVRVAKSLETQKDNLAVLKTGLVKRTIQSGIAQTSLDLGLLKYFTENRYFACNFVDSLMSEILVGEIVPDVLIEALTDSSLKVWQQPKKSYYIAATKDEKLEAVLDWDSLSLMDEIIIEVVKDLSVSVIRSTVRGFVDYHLLKSAVDDFIDEIIISTMQTELPSMIQEINDEIHLDDMLQYLIDSVIGKEVKNTVIVVLGELEAQVSALQENQISASANKYLVDTFLLEHLVGMIGGNQSATFAKDASLNLLDSMMLDILLRQQLRIVRGRQVTLENHSMKIVHQKAFSAVALDVIMTELSMMIDEDMEDIFEYERDIAFGGSKQDQPEAGSAQRPEGQYVQDVPLSGSQAGSTNNAGLSERSTGGTPSGRCKTALITGGMGDHTGQIPNDYNKRIYQGVRVKHTVKDLLAEKRSRQTSGSRSHSSANVSQTPFVQMSSSPVLSGYYGVRRSFLPESEIHTTKQYSNDLYSPNLGSKSCDLTSIQSYPPLLDPYFAESIGDYRGTSITSGSSSLFGPSSLPPLIPHFSSDPSHYLLRDSWEQTVPDTINQLDVLCSDTAQTVSSTNCISQEPGGVHYRSSSRGSVAQGTQPYSLHALDDVHYSTSFPSAAPYGFSPFMTVTNELTPKMSHHLSPDDSTETNTLQDNSSWPKDDSNTAWSPYELRRNY